MIVGIIILLVCVGIGIGFLLGYFRGYIDAAEDCEKCIKEKGKK